MFKTRAKKQKEQQKQPETRKETDLCASHPQKVLDLFCSECDDVYCRECIETGSHERYKRHKLKYISDVAYVFANSEEFKHYDKNIFDLRKKLERSLEKTKENKELSTQLKEDADNTIEQQKKTLTELIETHYSTISKRNKEMNDKCLIDLNEVMEKSDALKTEFEDIENKINEKRKCKMVTLFIAIKKSKKQIEKIEEEIQRLNERNNVTRYVFEAGKQALTFMKNVNNFGNLVEENLNSQDVSPFDSTLDDNDSRETTTPQWKMKLISKHQSLQMLPSQIESAHVERVYSQLEFSDSTASMSSLHQLSRDSKESLNSSNGSSEAVPKDKPVRDTSPQDYIIPEHEQTIDNTVPPRPGPIPSDLVIKQTTESKDFKDRGFGSRIQETEMYKVCQPYTSDDESFLSCKKDDIVTVLNKSLDGIHWLAKLEGHVGLIRSDYLKAFESGLHTSVMDQLGGHLDHNSRIFDHDQAFDRTVRDPSPQDFSVPEHEHTIDSTGPTQSGHYSSGSRNKPTVPPKPSAQMKRQTRERQSLRDRGFAKQTQPEPNKKYKVLYSFTTRDEEYLSYIKGDIVTVLKNCSGGFILAERRGQCGYIRKDHLEEAVETGSNANVLSELEAKLRSRYSVS